MDPADDDEKAWCEERRAQVIGYLRDQGLRTGEVGEVPAWFLAPHVSVWAIESLISPGAVGWWVVCGDLPTDYCSAEGRRHPRMAMKHIAENWLREIASTKPGASEIGSIGLDIKLEPLLRIRAKLLLSTSADDEAWVE